MDLIIWGALSLHLFGRVFLSSEEVRGVSVVRDEANNPLQIPVTAPDTGIPPCEALPLEEGTAEKGRLHTDHSPGLGEEGSPLGGDDSCHIHLILGLLLTRRCHSVTVF